MAIQDIQTYNYKNLFSLSIVDFDKACVVNKPQQVEVYTIYWIKNGTGIYNIDFKSYQFSNNVLFFLSPGQMFTVDSEKIKEAYKITFSKDFYCIQTHDKEVACNGVLFNNIYNTQFVKPCTKDTNKLNLILNGLIEEFKQDQTAQYDMLQSYLKQFIVTAVRIQKENLPAEIEVDHKLFKDFSTLVEQNFKTIHSVTDYANRLGLSPKSITKNFSKLGVLAPSDFIKNRIITEAKRYLIYTDNSVKQIAYGLGFNDSAYFTRFFKKATQTSPTQFRKDY